jgi:eukaryotic-like serine/threonine-protein kinase
MSKYSAVREIGCGGFGVVEEVCNSRSEHLARKTFRPAANISPNAYAGLKKRFKREVKIQTMLGGQEILPVIASDLEADAPWFVMPLADKTYETQIAEDRLSGKVDADAIADILNALQYLHDLGYTHRDLNPKNILRHDGHWKLTDLGAVLPPTGNTVTLTEGTLIYTELYCSPEQRHDFHAAQPSSDVYSFGCILHDLFGGVPRTPYTQLTAPDPMGAIIEKCTELNPARRPSIKALRKILLETLVEMGGQCKVEDRQAQSWLNRLDCMETWSEDDYAGFARYFAQLDTEERTPDCEGKWVYSLSTPFLTRLPSEALEKIVARQDGVSAKIVEKYCDWVRNTAFLFHFADTVSARLASIFDAGTHSDKAQALIALIELGYSHNRYYVMRKMLARCGQDLPKPLERRLAIEIQTEEMEEQFRQCVRAVPWDKNLLSTDIAKICTE